MEEIPVEKFLNVIFIADSSVFMKKIPENSIDLIVTSPPYNMGMEYDVYDDDVEMGKYLDFLDVVWSESYRVLKEDGRLAINMKPVYSKHINSHHLICERVSLAGFLWRTEYVWDTGNFSCPAACRGSYVSPSCNHPLFTHEFIEIFDKKERKKKLDNLLSAFYDKKDLIDITELEFQSWGRGIWEVPAESGMNGKFGHPAVFPEAIPERIMKLYSFVGDIVLDPFNGVGTTSKVAAVLSRFFIGIDVSEQYCKKALHRVLGVQKNVVLDDKFAGRFPVARVIRNL